jgi:hypothetical protein
MSECFPRIYSDLVLDEAEDGKNTIDQADDTREGKQGPQGNF